MPSVPLDSVLSSPQIDYLSSLPNELLDDIFEHAYIDSRPKKPLSKRLVHWFEKHLYRHIPRFSLSGFEIFLITVCNNPAKGHFVRTLRLSATSDDGSDSAALASMIRRLLPLLPNLVTLDAPSLSTLCTSISDLIGSPLFLPHLQSFETIIPDEGPDNLVCLDFLAHFSALPGLQRLRIDDWKDWESQYLRRSETTLLPSVTKLEVQGMGADVEIVKFLLDTCPGVLHLELEAEWEEGPEFVTRLPLLPSTLHSLSLHSTYPARDPVDSILSRLTQLRYLHLGKGCYTRNLLTVLQQLPHLVELHLDHGTLDPTQLQALLADPSRLIPMQRITLNFDEGQTGRHIPKPSTVATDHNFGFESDFLTYSILMLDWGLPGAEVENTPNVSDLGMLESVAEDNRLGIKGNLKSTIQMITDYHIEANNRAVLMSYRHGDLASLRNVQTASTRDGVAPPPLDLDSLDIDRLEIVEIDLPEQDWFMLSLRNKE